MNSPHKPCGEPDVYQKIAIVGGGVTGSLLALKLAQSKTDTPHPIIPILVESQTNAGLGLAYGAADSIHLLNVPVSRMEVGLSPSFESWLGDYAAELVPALEESDGDLSQAFVPRYLFGRYIYEQTQQALRAGTIRRIRGMVTRLQLNGGAMEQGLYTLYLEDGRSIAADKVVLATGNLPPKAPKVMVDDSVWLQDSALFVPDPWAAGAYDDLAHDAPVLLIGTGLTAIDIALKLRKRGHQGHIWMVSRRGLLPNCHQDGGGWPAFLTSNEPRSPLNLFQELRANINQAMRQKIPWQRVMDAMRPFVPQIWAAWSDRERKQFLCHARPYWDVHRHRLAPRIFNAVQALREQGDLTVMAGRLYGYVRSGDRLKVKVKPRHGHDSLEISAARVINCTGPRSDFAEMGFPLYADLRDRGLVTPDKLGLGIETYDAHVIDKLGHCSDSLFALGPLTRAAWWEITAVPEISVQVTRLVKHLTSKVDMTNPAQDFFDLGAGI